MISYDVMFSYLLNATRSDFCSDSDFRLRGVSPQTCGRGRSEQHKQILTLSIGKLFPIVYRYYYTHF